MGVIEQLARTRRRGFARSESIMCQAERDYDFQVESAARGLERSLAAGDTSERVYRKHHRKVSAAERRRARRVRAAARARDKAMMAETILTDWDDERWG